MKLSIDGLNFIIAFEGKLKPIGDGRYQSYRCPAGVWTIYTGCTEGVTQGLIVTEAEGQAMFAREMEKHERAVERLVTVALSQAQFDALVSFSYNAGAGALQSSTLLKKLNRGDVLGASNEFRQWTKAKNPKTGKLVELPGLVRRRKAEAALFVSDLPESEAMPQAAVEVQPMSTGAKVTAGLGAGTVATTAVQSVPAVPQSVPAVPQAVSDGIASAQSWQGIGTQVSDLAGWVVATPLVSVPLVAVVIVLGWVVPKLAERKGNTYA